MSLFNDKKILRSLLFRRGNPERKPKRQYILPLYIPSSEFLKDLFLIFDVTLPFSYLKINMSHLNIFPTSSTV